MVWNQNVNDMISYKKKKDADKLEEVWQRDTKMVRGLEH